jgi:hypothetical protein
MEEKKHKLDERRARTNLGPRTIGYIVATMLGSLPKVCHPSVLGRAVGGGLAVIAELEKRASPTVPDFDESELTSTEAATVLSGFVTGLCLVAPISAVRTAIGWLAERDDVFWKDIENSLVGATQQPEAPKEASITEN